MALKWKLNACEALACTPTVSWILMTSTQVSFHLTSEAEAGT